MAKHFSEVKRELEQSDGHMAGIGQQLKLSEEARDARNAGRRLEDENDETDLIGTVKKLEDLIAEQRRSNERIAREMRGMASEMKDVLEKVEELTLVRDKYPVLGLPIIRGAVTFVDSMVKGVKALMFSADYFPDEDVAEPSKFDQWLEKKLGNEKMQKFITALAVFLSLGLTILFFFLLPTFLAGFIDPYIKSAAVHNLVESVIKLVIFFAYMILCSKQKDIYRVFQYHGAEHKTIFCYEAGLPLTVENCRIQPRHHPRCGTSFLFVVVVVSILVSSLVFSFVNWRNMWVRMALHLLLLIPIVGVTYEFNRYVGGHDNKVTRFLARPGLWLQNFTTNEPDDSMLEVAIEALKLVIPDEAGADRW